VHAALCLLLLTAPTAAGGERDVLVVTSAPPLDGERLADALRAYLGDSGIDVRTAPAGPSGDLRHDLAETRQAGEAVRAVAAVRVGGAGASTVEIQVVDRVTDKVLLASIPRPPRLEDLYRAVALKVQALLRSTLAESPELLRGRPDLARLAGVAATSPSPADASTPAHRLALATGYALSSFPLGGLTQQGLSVSAAYTFRNASILGARLEAGFSLAALQSAKASSGDVTVMVDRVPVGASLALRWSGPHAAALVGVAGEIAFTSVTPSGPPMTANSQRAALPGLGGLCEGRWALGDRAWVFARGEALGMLLGERYLVRGAAVVDTSRLQASASAGLGVAVW
jgi:hypothetical protein